jgi:mono/diheme cytochrome c family protein
MEGHDVGAPDQPEPSGKSDQQLFDEQVARGGRRAFPILVGLGVVVALVMSTIALVNSGGNSTTTVTALGGPAAGQTTTDGQSLAPSGDALGKQLFVSGNPGVAAIACGSCHTMKAAGSTGTIGPNLDKELTADPASATRESTVDPNKEIAKGYQGNIMPTNYGTALTEQQLTAVVNFVYHSTNTKAKAKAKAKAKRVSTTTSTTP